DKNMLLKVVRITDDGMKTIKFDPGVKLQGRGAWVCRKKECIEKAKKSRAFERMLKACATEGVYGELLCVT
ncbi:MAG: YlxR family protein, partial [Synergistaceae bacterium]|nr:YlxR family protein [Synergistaceae bacterium]